MLSFVLIGEQWWLDMFLVGSTISMLICIMITFCILHDSESLVVARLQEYAKAYFFKVCFK